MDSSRGGVEHARAARSGRADRLRVVLVVAVATLALAVAAAAGATPADPDGRIAFVRDAHGIFAMAPDGTDLTQLTAPPSPEDPAQDEQPAWSPDATRIAFMSRRAGNRPTIHLMNADGTGQTQLTDARVEGERAFDEHPSWSPDGTTIAFDSDRDDGRYRIYTMRPDGTEQAPLTHHGASIMPAWSPDGTRLAIARRTPDLPAWDIHVINANGTAPIRLTGGRHNDFAPAWSPDGTRIAFVRRPSGTVRSAIHVMNADGSEAVALTGTAAVHDDPTWSPDGSSIAFTRWSEEDGHAEVYVMNADGSGVTQLTEDPRVPSREPAWWGPLPAPPVSPCEGAQVADYLDRADIRVVHRRGVDCVTELGIAAGARDPGGESVYRPRAAVTRGQMASFVVRTLTMAGMELPGTEGDMFSDIAGTVHRGNINRLAQAGVVVGAGGETFRPDAPVSRQQMASFLVRAAEFATDRNLTSSGDWFADVTTTNVHADNINVGLEQLLFEGAVRPVDQPRSGVFAPQPVVARDQMATFVAALVEWLNRTDAWPAG